MSRIDCELLIIGAGPAGLSAGLYASRAKVETVLLERGRPGGQVLTTEWVENYPGFPDGISGPDLAQAFEKHAQRFGLTSEYGQVDRLEREGDVITAFLSDGKAIRCKAVILSVGAAFRKLGVTGEAEFSGRGVSYCATCDGPFFGDQEVAVVGGGNMAVEEGTYLTRFARHVHIIHRRDKLRADRIIQERAFANDKMVFHWDSIVTEICGEDGVDKVRLKNVKTGQESELPVSGVFIFIGVTPNTGFLKGFVDLDEMGYVITDGDMVTSVPGVCACGDCRRATGKQAVIAAGEGALAALSVEQHLESLKDS